MLEMIMGGKTTPKGTAPILGYNWDKDVSTSSPVDTTYSGGVAYPLEGAGVLAGYNQCRRALSTIISLSKTPALNTIGLSDFTAEGWFWCTTLPSSYQPVFQIRWAGIGDIFMQFGDNGFGNRLQTGMRAAFGNAYTYNTSFTKASFVNKWHHLAIVRKDKKVRVYIDGLLQSMAVGGSTSYNTIDMDGDVDLQGTPSICQLSSTYATPSDIFVPEFLLSLTAKYTDNFTPPVGPIYRSS